MKITLNNKVVDFKSRDKLTVNELLKLRNFTYKLLIVRINNKIISKENYDNSIIKDGDDVVVLHLIAGG